MKFFAAILLTAGCFALSGCEQNQTPDTEAPAQPESAAANPVSEEVAREQASQRLAELFEEFFEENLKLNPIQATAIGDSRYNDQLPNFLSEAFRKQVHDQNVKWREKITEVDRSLLTGTDRISYDIFVYNRKLALEGEKYPSWQLPINQMNNFTAFIAQLGSGKSLQPFQSVVDYDNWLARANASVGIMDQAISNMNIGIENNIVQPRALMEKVLPQLSAHVVDDPEQSIFYQPIANMPEDFSEANKARLTEAYTAMISERMVPAFKRLHDYVANDYMQHTRDSFGISELPDGIRWYNFLVRVHTTTTIRADEIHRMGLSEVKRIRAEMEEVMKEVGFEGTLAEFFKYVQTEDKFYYDNEEDLLQGYRDLQAKVNERLPKLFDIAPKADYEVRAVEAFRAESAAGASYMPGTPDGSRPGIFYVNTFNLRAQPKFGMETLSLHEASPGHHFQLSIQQEIEDMPKFRRFGGTTAFAEGWALYAESIGKEMGMFDDPMQYYGKLSDEMLRAMRLVVDTGLHSKGWTRQQAIDYMIENSSMAESDVVAEVERYIAIPGQALAYKVGQRIILDMREKAQMALGDQFDPKAFHRQVLIDGAVPMDVLKTKLGEWIEDELEVRRGIKHGGGRD